MPNSPLFLKKGPGATNVQRPKGIEHGTGDYEMRTAETPYTSKSPVYQIEGERGEVQSQGSSFSKNKPFEAASFLMQTRTKNNVAICRTSRYGRLSQQKEKKGSL